MKNLLAVLFIVEIFIVGCRKSFKEVNPETELDKDRIVDVMGQFDINAI